MSIIGVCFQALSQHVCSKLSEVILFKKIFSYSSEQKNVYIKQSDEELGDGVTVLNYVSTTKRTISSNKKDSEDFESNNNIVSDSKPREKGKVKWDDIISYKSPQKKKRIIGDRIMSELEFSNEEFSFKENMGVMFNCCRNEKSSFMMYAFSQVGEEIKYSFDWLNVVKMFHELNKIKRLVMSEHDLKAFEKVSINYKSEFLDNKVVTDNKNNS